MSYPVAIQNQPNAVYPDTAPYDAPEVFPESPFPERTDPSNGVYATVREAFRLLKLDEANDGAAEWNPLVSDSLWQMACWCMLLLPGMQA